MELPFEDLNLSKPPGFYYSGNFISGPEQGELLNRILEIELKPFLFHGYTANRLVRSFGLKYDFTGRQLEKAQEPPPFMQELAKRLGDFFRLDTPVVQMQVTKYDPGTLINWHRDAPPFAEIMGISLLSPARFRLRKIGETGRKKYSEYTLLPGSVYQMKGEVRENWEHCITAQVSLRYSLTFRTLKPGFAPRTDLV